MLRTVVYLVLAAVAGLLAWVAVQPDSYRVERSALINAPPAAVYAHVYDFEKWQAWSPWAKRDPDAKITYLGPKSGPGAIMRWDGNDSVGRGAMAMTEAKPDEAIKIRLDFVEPMEGTSDVGFTFKPEAGGTQVTWSIDGRQGYVERLICTVLRIDVEQMIGEDYERGLANLKTIAEASPPPAAAPAVPPQAETPPG